MEIVRLVEITDIDEEVWLPTIAYLDESVTLVLNSKVKVSNPAHVPAKGNKNMQFNIHRT